MQTRLFRVSLLGLLVLLVAGSAYLGQAQTISGIIAGTVIDQQGAALPGVTITVTNPETGRTYTTSTNDQGYYRVSEVSPGVYQVLAELGGFQRKQHDQARVSVNKVTTEDFVLEVPPKQEEVIVESSAAPLTDTTGPTLSAYYTDRQVRELPILTRDINNLALLAPGVTSTRTFSFASTLVPFAVNGSRGRDNNFIIDSVDNNEPLFGGAATQFTNTDIFAEYTILTHQTKAEFGRNSGATVNVITRSGSNLRHGTLYWFGQHDAFNARSRVEKASLLDDPATAYENQLGFTLGGPLKKDKAFYFLSYQWDRAVNNQSTLFPVLATLPTDAGLATLSGLTQTPALRALLGSATVSSVPVVAAPCFREPPTFPGFSTTNPCLTTSTSVMVDTDGDSIADRPIPFNVFLTPNSNLFVVRDHQASARLDFPINATNDFYGRYLFDDLKVPRIPLSAAGDVAFSDLGLLADWQQVTRQRTQSLLLNWRHYWVNALNEMRFSSSRVSQSIGPFRTSEAVRETQAGATVADNFGGFGVFSTQFPAAGQRFTLGRESRPSLTASSIFQVQDNFSYNRGRHSLKFGLNFVRIRSNIRNTPSDLGQYFFGIPLVPGGFDEFINEGDMRFGTPSNAFTVLQRFPNVISDSAGNILGQGPDTLPLREFDQFYFFQDDFRANAKFTLSFGLRYEHYGQPVNRIRELNPAGPSVDADNNNFAPRIGFAWSPWKNTVIRAGYGFFYNPMVLNIPLLVWQSGPVSPFFSVDAIGFSDWQPSGAFPDQPLTLADVNVNVPFCSFFTDRATVVAPPAGVPLLRCSSQETIAPDLANPYIQHFSFGWQQSLSPSWLVEIGYVGSKGTKLYQRVDENPFTGWDTACTAVSTPPYLGCLFPRANDLVTPGTGGITRMTNGGRSTYHSLQFNLTKRLSRTRAGDFAFTAAYTWSHMIDNVSEIFGPGFRFLLAANPFNALLDPSALENVEAITPLAADPTCTLSCERADSAFDRRQRLAVSYLWELPSPDEGAKRFFFGGVQFNGVITLQSGQPFSPLNGGPLGSCRDYNGDGRLTNDRPAIGNPSAPASSIALLADPSCTDLSLGYVDPNGNPIDPSTARFVQVPLGVAPGAVFTDLVSGNSFVAGSAGRNSLTGPGIVNFDFAVYKNFRWGESKNIQFRWEIYDLFNTANPGFAIGNVFATEAQPTPAFAFSTRRTPAGVTGAIPENTIDAVDPFTGVPNFLSRRFMNTSSRRMQFGIKFIF